MTVVFRCEALCSTERVAVVQFDACQKFCVVFGIACGVGIGGYAALVFDGALCKGPIYEKFAFRIGWQAA
jgi:hypothetical protein